MSIVNNTGLTPEQLAQKKLQESIEKSKAALDRLKPAGKIDKSTFELNANLIDPKTLADAKASGIAKQDGLNGKPLLEAFAKLDSSQSEKVISGQNNTWVVLGRDNPSRKDALSWGSIGANRAGAIDIFSGIGGTNSKSSEFAGKNFVHDSARLYLSMKANIDNYLSIPSKTINSPNSIARSCALLISDDTRLIGRHSIKILAGSPTNTNSNGDTIKPAPCISLMGDYNEDMLQPVVKGENLKKLLKEIIDSIRYLNSQLAHLTMAQNEYNLALSTHVHAGNVQLPGCPQMTSPPANLGALPASTSKALIAEIKGSLVTQIANLEPTEKLYLDRFQDSKSSNAILSDTVFTT